ncbi:MAG: DUF4037 domain-containing protein [Oscillospiraceae bacterium]|nr:DUF4037 domain-containing protein [Oscillospiraceae bacterium]
MTGLELSRHYYEEIGRPVFQEKFAEYMPRIAAGLVGEGSECFGFDDEISRDHDFGPGFCIWLCKEDYEKIGAEMQAAYMDLPKEFMGFPARKTSPRGGGRVDVFEISAFYHQFVGSYQPPKSMMEWLYLPEHKIATAVNGEVFEDNLGQFTAMRNTFLAYYPEDVRIKKIAARAAAMAQSGQYNYGRCMRRGDTVAAQLAEAEFIKAALSMLHLLNKHYCPYYKWQLESLQSIKRKSKNIELAQTLNLIISLAETADQTIAWETPYPDDFNPYVNTYDHKVVLIEDICKAVVKELRRQGLTDTANDFLEAHTYHIMSRIQDDRLKLTHITEG